MDTFDGRVAVITGAASGIGFALAQQAIELGMYVVAADVAPDRLDDAVAELGDRAVGHLTDVADRASVQALADAAFERHGAVHLLCNNAGVTARTSLLEATHHDWEWVLGVNVWGVIHGIEAFVPRMVAGGEPGHVVNTCSMAGFLSSARYGIYCATKHAVAAISEALAGDLAEAGAPIGVTAPCPSAVATNFVHAERTRPERFGGATISATAAVEAQRIADAAARAQSPEHVAAVVFDGIRRNELFVFPEPDAVAPARERMHRILG